MEREEIIKYLFLLPTFCQSNKLLCVVMGTFCEGNVLHRRSVLRNRMYRFITVV